MKPEDVRNYYGTNYKFSKATKMSPSSIANWLLWGYVPLNSQYKLQCLTKGKLKAEWTDKDK